MPDILLIQPPIRDFYLTVKRTIPYGLACIAATLRDSGFSVKILDALATTKSRICDIPPELNYLSPYYGRPDRSAFALFHHYRHFGYSFGHIGKLAGESGAFLVGISALFTPYVSEALQTARTVKAFHPACKIVVGGHHATAMPQSIMESPVVDFVIRGEGEVSMHQLAKAVATGGAYDSIPGLVFRRGDGSLHINPPAGMPDPDDYPLPAADLIDQRFYRRNKRAAMVVVAGRGCPMKCSYCSLGAGSHVDYRKRSVEAVIEEIRRGVENEQVGFIDFEDENLSLDRRWFLELLSRIRSRFGQTGLELRAMNGLYPPSLDEEVIRAMRCAGFKTLNLALGSSSKKQLQRFSRSDVRPAFDRALKIAEAWGMDAVGYVICAAPFQEPEDSISDLLYLAQRRVLAGVSVFYPAPGSRDFGLCQTLGILPDHFSCMRSSALPVSHTTSRKDAATLLRLGRILNFMKSLVDRQIDLETADLPGSILQEGALDRIETSRRLLSGFLRDGRIRGVTPQGEIFDHPVSQNLTRTFLTGLASIPLRGSR